MPPSEPLDFLRTWYNMHILVEENGRMAIHSMCGLCTWYNMHILVEENGRMATHTMINL